MSDLGNKLVFAKNLKYYMKLTNKSRNEICKDLGFAYTTFASWENATAYPRIDKIEMLAAYFSIQKSDLIEKKNDLKKKDIFNKSKSIEIIQEINKFKETLRSAKELKFDGKPASQETVDKLLDVIQVGVELIRKQK